MFPQIIPEFLPLRRLRDANSGDAASADALADDKKNFAALINAISESDGNPIEIPDALFTFALNYPHLVDKFIGDFQDKTEAEKEIVLKMRKQFILYLNEFASLPYRPAPREFKEILSGGWLGRLLTYKESKIEINDLSISFTSIFNKIADKYPSLLLSTEIAGPDSYLKGDIKWRIDCKLNEVLIGPEETPSVSTDLKSSLTDAKSATFYPGIKAKIADYKTHSCIQGARLFDAKTSSRYPHRVAEIDKHLRYLHRTEFNFASEAELFVEYTPLEKASNIIKSATEALKHPRSVRSLWYIMRDDKTTQFYQEVIDRLCYVDDTALINLYRKLQETDFQFRWRSVGGVVHRDSTGAQKRMPKRVKKIHDLLAEITKMVPGNGLLDTDAPQKYNTQRALKIREIVMHAAEGIKHGGPGQTRSTIDFYEMVIDTLITKEMPSKSRTLHPT